MERNRKPVWSKWRLVPEWALWEAVALSMDIDPAAVRRKAWNSGFHPGEFSESNEFKRRAEILYRIVETGKPERSSLKLQKEPGAELAATILPADFVQWVEAQAPDWKPLPSELSEISARESTPVQTCKWPWGDYETDLLRCLDAAARRFWVNYDPTDPTTAHTNDDVADWLQREFNLSQNKAQAIATILRADGLPAGPRR